MTDTKTVKVTGKDLLTGLRKGTCEGRDVRFTHSVGLWYFADTGEYIYNARVAR